MATASEAVWCDGDDRSPIPTHGERDPIGSVVEPFEHAVVELVFDALAATWMG